MAYEHSDPYPAYIGNIDPKKWWDVLAATMVPERTIFGSIIGNISAGASCPLYEALDMLPGYYKRGDSAGEKIRSMIDSLYYGVGCLGPVPVGTISVHDDPIATAILSSMSVFSDLFTAKGVGTYFAVTHTTKNSLNGFDKDILCHPIRNPLIPMTQYTVQLLYPTVSKTHELGVNPLKYAYQNARGMGNTTVVLVINKRRDYAAFAYSYASSDK